MPKKKKDTMEFRFYEVPQGEAALVLCGDSWIRVYGSEGDNLHFHNLMEIGICHYCSGSLYLDEEVYHYRDNMLTVIPENYPHTTVSEGEDNNFWEYVFLDMNAIIKEIFPDNPVYQEKIIKLLSEKAFITDIQSDPEPARLVKAIIQETKSQKPFCQKAVRLYIEMLMLELIRRGEYIPAEEQSKVKGSNLSQIAAALDYINKNYYLDIRIRELADICNMSETHFRRIFEEYINMSPMDYVNLNRIQKACEMLKKTNDSMDVIAAKCGFNTTSTFNRNFKKYLNTSPYQWKINPNNYANKLLNFRISALKGW